MSGNINCANYCDFNNRRSNIRVNQTPGIFVNKSTWGNSSLSLAWNTEEVPKKNLQREGINRQIKENNENALNYNNGLEQRKRNNASSYDAPQSRRGYENNEPEKSRAGNNYYAEYQQKYLVENNKSTYEPSTKSSKQSYDAQKYQELREVNYQQPQYSQEVSQRQNSGYDRNRYAGQASNQQSQRRDLSNNIIQHHPNIPRHPNNNVTEVKSGYRVNQPPGGKSSIIFG